MEMSVFVQHSIKSICLTFCKDKNYIDCKEIGRGTHSIVFKASEQNSGKGVCFKIIPEKEYNQSPEEWNIVSLLRKFIFKFFS
jgi:serine/threonine protein kinase